MIQFGLSHGHTKTAEFLLESALRFLIWLITKRLYLIEHNLDVIKCADWIIDLGPDAGVNGGRIIATGTPEQIAKCKKSETGRYLAPVLAKKHGENKHFARTDEKGENYSLDIEVHGARKHNAQGTAC